MTLSISQFIVYSAWLFVMSNAVSFAQMNRAPANLWEAFQTVVLVISLLIGAIFGLSVLIKHW